MSKWIPESRPQMTREDLLRNFPAVANIDLAAEKFAVIGVRGYYKKSFGDPNKNDRGVYDDAVFVLTETDLHAFNSNTDPQVYRKGIADLNPGLYRVVKHMHHGKYAAFQIVRDDVARDGGVAHDVGHHSINIHYGGPTNTYSEGCQTLPKPQFVEFQPLVYRLMDLDKKADFAYLLVEA